MKVTIEKVKRNSENRFHQKSSYSTLECYTENRVRVFIYATDLYLSGKLEGNKLIKLKKRLPRWIQENNTAAIENCIN